MAQAVAEGKSGARRFRAPRFIMALPAWMWFVFFFAIPVAFIFYYSFGYKPGAAAEIATDRLSFDRYGEVFDPTLFRVFASTLRISVLATLLCLLIGFPFAYWLAAKVSSRWKGLLLGLCIIPFWTNFLIRTIGLKIFLNPQGTLYDILSTVGLREGDISILFTKTAVQIGVVYNYLPLMIFPLFVALERLDPTLREASKDLGANRWKTFRQVTLPLAAPGIVAGLLLVFIPLTGDYITPAVLGGADGNMVGNLVASQFLVGQNWAKGSASAVVLIGMILITIGIAAVLALGIRAVLRSRRRLVLPEPAGA